MNKKLTALIAFLLLLSLLFGCSKAEVEPVTATALTTVAQTKETSTESKKKTTEKTTEASTTSTTKKAETTTEKAKAKVKSKRKKNAAKKQEKTTAKATTTKPVTKKVDKSQCTLTINCKVILSHMDDLKDGHEEYVPSNGYILRNYSVKYEEGDTVYSVLKRVCRDNGIPMRAKMTGFGMYVEGINNIFEKDCGANSGWTYYVDGEFPMLSVEKYELHGGEVIEFKYVV